MMKKSLFILLMLCVTLSVLAFEYIPKNTDQDPFAKNTVPAKMNNIQSSTNTVRKNPESILNKEITNLNEYFQYLPYAVNKNWIPYQSNADYEVSVQFRVHEYGSISDVEIVESSNEKANISVLNAVKAGAPYKPLPKSYPSDTVKAQVILEYHK